MVNGGRRPEASAAPPQFVGLGPAPEQRISLVIAIPFQRADLPAIGLILLAVALVGWGSWFVGGTHFSAATEPPGVMAPLLISLLQQKAISLTSLVALALLILAAALAVAPLRWWAYMPFFGQADLAAQLSQRQPKHRPTKEVDEAEAWVAAQAEWIEDYQNANGQRTEVQSPPESSPAPPTPTTAGETAQGDQSPPTAEGTTPAATETPAANGQPTAAPAPPTQEAPPAAQQPQPAAQQPTEQQAAEQQATPPQEAQPPAPGAPAQKAPAGQQASAELAALAEETKKDELDLEGLTDVEDILSSFTDNDTISPRLLALSASVGYVDITELVDHSQAVSGHFAGARA